MKTTKEPSSRAKIIRTVVDLGGGFLKKAEDAVLLSTLFLVESLSNAPTSHGAWQAYEQALKDWAEIQQGEELDEDLLVPFKRAWQRIRKKGLVEWAKAGLVVKPRISAAGWRRLKEVLPTYDSRRYWDERVYLITYDIPESRKAERELLRRLLKKVGAGSLQLSVFLTPYDPRTNLKKLLKGTGLADRVLVSDFGEDGNIGGKSLRVLFDEVYHLRELKERYRQFLQDYRKEKLTPTEKMGAVVDYYAILKDDPQIPFPLLPQGWRGDEAYRFCRDLMGKVRQQ